MADRTQTRIGLAIIISSIAFFFWWGAHFRVFGTRMVFSVVQMAFFGWLLLGWFGVGYIAGGWRSGLKYVGGLALAFGAAVGFGLATGRY